MIGQLDLFGTSGCCSTTSPSWTLASFGSFTSPHHLRRPLCLSGALSSSRDNARIPMRELIQRLNVRTWHRCQDCDHGQLWLVASGLLPRLPAPLTSLLFLPLFPSGVGKTSLLNRYTQDKFDPKNTVSTTGAFFVPKKVYKNGLKVALQLWDTAGQERFRSMVCRLSTFTETSANRTLISLPCNPLLSTQHLMRHQKGTHVLSRRKCRTALVRYYECWFLCGYPWLARRSVCSFSRVPACLNGLTEY